MKKNLKRFILCSVFTAFNVVLTMITIPIGPVPVTMTHLSIFIGAGLLGPLWGMLPQVIYISLGAVGLPVFSGLSGGLAIILGPRGGFIFSYIICAFVTGLGIKLFKNNLYICAFSMLCGILVTYLAGVLWFMFITGNDFIYCIMICVVPFLAGDILKIIVSAVVINKLEKIKLLK